MSTMRRSLRGSGFNPYDLYSKGRERPDMKGVLPFYQGSPAVRHSREGDGNDGIIRSPLPPSLYPTEGPNSQVRPSGAKTRERGSGNFFSAQAQQRTAVEDFAVGFERHSVLKSPLVKQRGIVREVQESGGNFLDFGHAVVNQVKASFVVGGCGVI